MKRILYFCFIWLLVAGCNQDFEEPSIGPPVQNESSDYSSVRSQEEALEGLFAALERIDAPDETRAGTFRQVQSVTTLKTAAVCDPTRSGAIPDTEDLFYLVSFGEGKGSAVLGVDRRLPEVLAILDETVLTPEDFVRNDDTRSGEEEESPLDFILSRMIASSISTMASNPGGPGNPIGPGNPRPNPNEPKDPIIPRRETHIIENKRQPPLLKTKWGQWSPYNNYCNGCPAGCGPIAVGQFLAYHNAPNPNTIMGETFDWNLIHQNDYGKTPSEAAEDEVARYIRTLGIPLGTKYGPNASPTDQSAYAGTIKYLGFPNATMCGYDMNKAQQMIFAQKPFILRGKNSDSEKGHVWVVDGWHLYEARIIVSRGAFVISTETIRDVWAHCNFGWYGSGDGYYMPGLFNTDYVKEWDTSVGDVPSSKRHYYDEELRMVTY